MTIGFKSESYTVNEYSSAATVCAVIYYGELATPATVKISTLDNTAKGAYNMHIQIKLYCSGVCTYEDATIGRNQYNMQYHTNILLVGGNIFDYQHAIVL